ncbi:MAG: GtrA family protein [Anaerolineae bacterium]|nr:GtrA family protein [Anaerolineae bacterium]
MTQSDSIKVRRIAMRNPLDVPIEAISRRFGERSKEVERFLKFAFVGALGAVIDAGTLFALQATLLPPVDPNKSLKVVIASTIAFVAAVCSNFIWNRYWTYPDSRSRPIRRQLTQFAFISFVGWFGRTIWISASYIWLGALLSDLLLPEIQLLRPGYVPSESAEAKIGSMAAWFVGVIIVLLWNFFANRYWTYNDVD